MRTSDTKDDEHPVSRRARALVERLLDERGSRATAYRSHAALALIAGLALAAQFYLRNSPSEVVGAGIFLLFMLVGFPAIALIIWAAFHSLKASDRKLLFLTALLILLILAVILEAPLLVVNSLEVLYIVLALGLGILWWTASANGRKSRALLDQ